MTDFTITNQEVNEKLAELSNLSTLLDRIGAGRMSKAETASTIAYIRERLKAHEAELIRITGQHPLKARKTERVA